ncbi:phage protein [Staphylococcus simulans]|nr:phage protein [Staphylococcus simulans]
MSLEVKAQEIHERAVGFYKISEKYGYKFLMEVKTIRDEKLYEELGFENFEEYTVNNFNFSKRTINERLQDAESFGEDYERALASYGKHKTHQLATLPEKQRKHVMKYGIDTPDGNKSLEEATTRELEDYKKRNKSLEQQNAQLQSQMQQAQRSEQIALQKLENAQNKAPEVIEREVVKEVVPDDVKRQLEQFKQKFERESNNANELRDELEKYRKSFSDPNQAYEEKELYRLERESSINAHKIAISIQNFIKENSVETYRLDTIIKANPKSKERLEENVALLKEFTSNLEAMLNGRIIVN